MLITDRICREILQCINKSNYEYQIPKGEQNVKPRFARV